ncbi:MAG: CHAT domain-containing protein [Syntrophorhabdaceae bacterium]|nr:CHAT domain-containing protein [Syntrophorhabdaceae bacterium]
MKNRMFFLYVCLSVLLFPLILHPQQTANVAELLSKGAAAYKSQEYQQALAYLTEAYKNLESGDNVSLKAMVQLNIGITYYSMKRVPEALPYLQSAYTSFEARNSKTNTAVAADVLGASYLQLGQTEKGLSYFDVEVSLLRELKMNTELAKLLLVAGKIRISRSDDVRAYLNYDEALKIYKEHNLVELTPLFVGAGHLLEQVGLSHCSRNHFGEGLEAYEEAIRIHRQTKRPINIARSLISTGTILGSQYIGQYHRALSHLQEALTICRELEDKRAVAECYSRLGGVYNSIGQHNKALDNHQTAYEINSSLNAQREMLVNLRDIGFTYYKMGQHDKALRYFHQVSEAGGKALANMYTGMVYISLGENEKAITLLNDALECRPQDPMVLMNLGLAHTLQKEYSRAEEMLLAVEEMRRKATGHMWQGVPYLIELYIETARYDDALACLAKMQPQPYTDDPYRILFHTQYGSALRGKNLLKAASTEFLKAVNVSEEIRGGLKEKEGFFAAGFAGSHIRAFKSLVAVLCEGALKGDTMEPDFLPYGTTLASAAFYFAESTKARSLLEDMAASSAQHDSIGLSDDLKLREARLLNQLSSIQNEWEGVYKKRNQKDYLDLVKRKKMINEELNALISEIRAKYPRYAALHYPKPVPPEAIPLKQDETLLEYVIDDDATYLFKVKRGGLESIYKIEMGKEEIERMVNKYVRLLQDPNSTRGELLSCGKRLYGALLEKPLGDISRGNSIIIVPDGVLGLLPFEALAIEPSTDGKSIAYVGDRHRIIYFQSASILALNRMLRPSAARKILFALGDPIYSVDDRRYVAFKKGLPSIEPSESTKNEKASFRELAKHKDWGKTTEDDKAGKELEYPRLPETATEVNRIAGFYGVPLRPPDILLNLNANETGFCNVPLRDYRYLHFATHADLAGKVQGINEPFLLLGQVENKPGHNGFLTLTKVLSLDLDADLVVLSACFTGRGNAMEGEGVMNFSRAFQHAGARSVISSLWAVASLETVEFMTTFYSKLKEGTGKAEALAFARNKIKTEHPHPYFWAPFVLYGEQ